MIVFVEVMPKKGIHDPQGKTVKSALLQLGFENIISTNVGKLIRLEIDTDSRENAEKTVIEMADRLLVNPNVESYRIIFPEGAES